MTEAHHAPHHEPANQPTQQPPFYQGQGGLCFVCPSVAQKAKNSKVAGTAANSNTNAAPTVTPPVAGDEPVIGNFRAVSDSEHILGDKKSPLTIVEWSDFDCPFCERFHPTVQKISDEYKGKVKFVYRHFPLTSLHPNAQKAAEASECVTELGGNDAFWKFADKILGESGQSTADKLVTYAKDIGLNETKFKSCLDAGKYTQKVQDDYNDAAVAGGQGTPYSVLIDSKGEKSAINGAQAYETIKAMIDAKL